jgi:hypothetical protein
MKEETTDALLREFLLGRLDDDTQERLESLFLIDPLLRERVLVIEQELVEDYLEDSLSQEDKKTFVSRYAQTNEQQRQLRITKSIKDWAAKEARTRLAPTATVSAWSQLWMRLRFKPALVFSIAVTIVIAIVLAVIWLNSQRERRKHLAAEQELTQLNSPDSMREIPPQMISRELRPVTFRSIEPQTEVNPLPGIRIVELRLPWIQKKRYSTYEAEIRRLHGDESFTIRNLQAESDGENLIRVRLPIHILSRGQYQIHLRGIAIDHTLSPAEEYSFVMSN